MCSASHELATSKKRTTSNGTMPQASDGDPLPFFMFAYGCHVEILDGESERNRNVVAAHGMLPQMFVGRAKCGFKTLTLSGSHFFLFLFWFPTSKHIQTDSHGKTDDPVLRHYACKRRILATRGTGSVAGAQVAVLFA